jgi:hypothetical protein
VIATQAQAQEIFIPRAYLVQRVGQGPKIDGLLDDACWQTAKSSGGFVDGASGNAPKQETTFRMVFDEKALYLAVELIEPDTDKLVANLNRHDTALWFDDSVEIFVQPDYRYPSYYHLIVNSSAVTYDSRDGDPNVALDWTAATRVEKGKWIVEAVLSFSSVASGCVPGRGDLWRINICRNRQKGKTHLAGARDAELSCWSRFQKGFHEQKAFGHVVFEGYRDALVRQLREIEVELTAVSDLTDGREDKMRELVDLPERIDSEESYRDILGKVELSREQISKKQAEALEQLGRSVRDQDAVILSPLPPYEALKKDSASQVSYLAKALKQAKKPIKLSFKQAINEYEHGGFTISTLKAGEAFTIRVSDLVSMNGKRLAKEQICCSVVRWLEPDPAYDPCYVQWSKEPVPELLEEIRRPISLGAGQTCHIWVTVNSIGASPEVYEGAIEIWRGQMLFGKVSITAEVWPFALPQRPKLDVEIFTSIPWGGQTGDLWARMLAEHYVTYINMEQPSDISIDGKLVVTPQGQTTKDIDLGMSIQGKSIKIPGDKYDHLERLKIIRKYGMKLTLYSGRGIIQKELLPFYIEYLKNAGFSYEDFRYKISDENFDSATLPVYQQYYKVDPRFRMVFCPAGDWDVSDYCPYVDTYMCSAGISCLESRWLPLWKRQQAQGKKISTYTNWPSYAERAPILQARKDLVWTWKHRLDEYAAWTMDIFPPLGYTYAYAPFRKGLTDLPPERQSVAALVYFRKEGNLYRPISCKRLEAIRDGVKDWMYLTILDQLIGQAEGKVENKVLARAKQAIGEVLKENKNTQEGYNCSRETLAKCIMELNTLLNPYQKK